jgi:Domain of unknown function DUF302
MTTCPSARGRRRTNNSSGASASARPRRRGRLPFRLECRPAFDYARARHEVGQRRKAVQYLVGNPLFAVEMTRHAIGAALYAPLRVLIYQDEPGTCIEYDLPSSLFGQFKDERVDRVALSLDGKLADLVAKATR